MTDVPTETVKHAHNRFYQRHYNRVFQSNLLLNPIHPKKKDFIWDIQKHFFFFFCSFPRSWNEKVEKVVQKIRVRHLQRKHIRSFIRCKIRISGGSGTEHVQANPLH